MRAVGRIAARGWAESPLDRRCLCDRVFYLSVDGDTTSPYGKHYF